MNIFISAIGTDSGKTLVSAIVTEALQADYWKPIQAGFPRDTDSVARLVTNPSTQFHPEAYLLQMPASPHAAAKAEGVEIVLQQIKLPKTTQHLVIEGAGGALVPLNNHDFVIDLASHLDCKVLLVSNFYLGSINHTLLTIELLKARQLDVMGIVFNGPYNPESARIIELHSPWPVLLKIDQHEKIDSSLVQHYAAIFKSNYDQHYTRS